MEQKLQIQRQAVPSAAPTPTAPSFALPTASASGTAGGSRFHSKQSAFSPYCSPRSPSAATLGNSVESAYACGRPEEQHQQQHEATVTIHIHSPDSSFSSSASPPSAFSLNGAYQPAASSSPSSPSHHMYTGNDGRGIPFATSHWSTPAGAATVSSSSSHLVPTSTPSLIEQLRHASLSKAKAENSVRLHFHSSYTITN